MRKMRFLYPNGKNKALTISYDDGVQFDERLVSILNKYNLKATFNVNSGIEPGTSWVNKGINISRIDLEANKELYKGHEIAIHTLTHPHLEELNDDDIFSDEIKEQNSSFNLDDNDDEILSYKDEEEDYYTNEETKDSGFDIDLDDDCDTYDNSDIIFEETEKEKTNPFDLF